MVVLVLANKSVSPLVSLINDASSIMETSTYLSYSKRPTLSQNNMHNYYANTNGKPAPNISFHFPPVKQKIFGSCKSKKMDKLSTSAHSPYFAVKPSHNNHASNQKARGHVITQRDFGVKSMISLHSDSFLETKALSKKHHTSHKHLLSAGLPVHGNGELYKDELNKYGPEQPDILGFSQIQNILIEASTDEDIHEQSIFFIRDFTTALRKPEVECLQYLTNTLLVTGTSEGRALTCHTYSTLKHILRHHRLSTKDFPQRWEQILDIIKPLNRNCGSLFSRNQLLYLDLLVDVFEDDLHHHKLNNTVRNSFVCFMLSPDFNMCNVSSVINILLSAVQWTDIGCRDCVNGKEQLLNKRLSCPCSRIQDVQSSSYNTCNNPSVEFAENRRIFLLHKILAMIVDVSKSPVEGATQIAEDILYPFRSLPKLDHRRRVLENLQCHMLRLELIELWLENCCELDCLEGADVLPAAGEPLSINKIVNRHFRFSPSEDVEDVGIACEELSMMQYFLMQSYINNAGCNVSKNKHQSQSPVCTCGPQLSIEDKTWLIGIGDCVTKLRYHLESFTELTPKTQNYLDYIEIFQDLVDV